MIQLVNKKIHSYDIFIGRPSIYGNPFKIGPDGNREEVVMKYRKYFHDRIESDQLFREAVELLRNKVLGCFCTPLLCHGSVFVEYLEVSDNNDRSI